MVFLQFGYYWRRHCDGALACSRLGWAEVGAAAMSLGAGRGTHTAAGRLGVLGFAAVSPGQPGEGVPDAQLALREIEVVPVHRESFALTQPEKGQRPAHPIAASVGSGQQGRYLVGVVGLKFGLVVGAWHVDEGDGIAQDVAATFSLFYSTDARPVAAPHRR